METGLHIICSMAPSHLLYFESVDICFDKKMTKSVNLENELSTG